MNKKLQSAVASLGHRVGAAKRRKHAYVSLPVEVAVELHKNLVSKVRADYVREYRKL